MDAAIVPAAASSPPPPLPAAAKRQRLDAVVVRQTPETLHPDLWLGHQLGRTGAQTVATGFARLDAELPDGGWPRGALSELLLAHPGVGEMRLLAPALVAAQRDGRLVMLFDPPAAQGASALGAGSRADDVRVGEEWRRD
jgi:protein ImuA